MENKSASTRVNWPSEKPGIGAEHTCFKQHGVTMLRQRLSILENARQFGGSVKLESRIARTRTVLDHVLAIQATPTTEERIGDNRASKGCYVTTIRLNRRGGVTGMVNAAGGGCFFGGAADPVNRSARRGVIRADTL